MTSHSEAGVKQSSTDMAGVRARLTVNGQRVFAMDGFSLERRATDVTYERPTRVMNGLVVRQMTL